MVLRDGDYLSCSQYSEYFPLFDKILPFGIQMTVLSPCKILQYYVVATCHPVKRLYSLISWGSTVFCLIWKTYVFPFHHFYIFHHSSCPSLSLRTKQNLDRGSCCWWRWSWRLEWSLKDERQWWGGGRLHEGDCKGERCAVRFKVRGVNADWSEQGWEKDDWTRPLMSQTAWQLVKVEEIWTSDLASNTRL